MRWIYAEASESAERADVNWRGLQVFLVPILPSAANTGIITLEKPHGKIPEELRLCRCKPGTLWCAQGNDSMADDFNRVQQLSWQDAKPRFSAAFMVLMQCALAIAALNYDESASAGCDQSDCHTAGLLNYRHHCVIYRFSNDVAIYQTTHYETPDR
jgi:hypothetical protein